MSLTIYTDGSCSPNPGKGGWAFVFIKNNREWCVSGGEKKTTNNKMELTAVIRALEFNSEEINFKIYSDSRYVINCAKGEWRKLKNVKLWEEYGVVSKNKNIEWVWVKGHSGDRYNDLVDELAKQECNRI